jgi:predicted nucleic acid-binding protein
MILVLDSGPLGVLSSPLANPAAARCHAWMLAVHASNRHHLLTSEICDFEVRRELLRTNRMDSIDRLEQLLTLVYFMPINRGTMLRAAELWAAARGRGRPTADPASLDADVILAAQAQLFAEETHQRVVVVSTNARHLAQFIDTRTWQEIAP